MDFKKGEFVQIVAIGDKHFGRYGIVEDCDNEYCDLTVAGKALTYKVSEIAHIDAETAASVNPASEVGELNFEDVKSTEKEESTPMVDVKDTIVKSNEDEQSRKTQAVEPDIATETHAGEDAPSPEMPHMIRSTEQDTRASYDRALYVKEKSQELLDYINASNTAGMRDDIRSLYDNVFNTLCEIYAAELVEATKVGWIS